MDRGWTSARRGQEETGKERCRCGRVWVTRRPCHVRFQPQPSSSTGPPRVSTSSRDVGSPLWTQVHLARSHELEESADICRSTVCRYLSLSYYTIIHVILSEMILGSLLRGYRSEEMMNMPKIFVRRIKLECR